MTPKERAECCRECLSMLEKVAQDAMHHPFEGIQMSEFINVWQVGRIGANLDNAVESLRRALWALDDVTRDVDTELARSRAVAGDPRA